MAKNLIDIVNAYTDAIVHNKEKELEYTTNCCFKDNIFYSYSTPIAIYIKENNVVYFTNKFYSKTTSHQRSVLRHSIATKTQCSVVMLNDDDFLKMV